MDAQEILLAIWSWVSSFLTLVYWYLEAIFRKIVPPPMKSIDGETILVTGAVGGIGKEISSYLLKSGTNIKLVLWDLNQAQLDKLAGELKNLAEGNGSKVFPFAVDISSRENIEAASKVVRDKVGPVSIVVNNAGIAPNGNFLQLTNSEIEGTFQVNLMSHLWILREFLPDMVLKNHGRIVNICSMGGLKAAPFALPYFSSKFGVNGYTESLKIELLLYNYDGIHCTTVYPYFVKTPMIKGLELKKGGLPGPFQNVLEPKDVARQTVDGMRREQEFVYAPSMIPILVLMDFFVPSKLRKHLQTAFKDVVRDKDEKEHHRVMTPYLEQIKSRQQSVKK